MIITYTVFLPMMLTSPPPPPKRGLAGSPYSTVDYVDSLNITWWQSWNTCYGRVGNEECIPMIWGWHGGKFPNDTTDYWENFQQSVPLDYNGHALFVNEPEQPSQSRLSPQEAVDLFLMATTTYSHTQWSSPQVSIGHPAAVVWLGEWWELLPEEGREELNFWGIHIYANDVAIQKAVVSNWVAHLQAMKDVPIWITEWGIDGRFFDDGGEAAVRDLAEWYDNHPAIERHALYSNWLSPDDWWSAPHIHMAMVNEDGITPIGRGWGVR